LDEHSFRRFAAIMKIVTAIGAVIVFFAGIHRFHVEQARLIEARMAAEQIARDREFGRELWLRQLDTLAAVANAASRIAAGAGGDQASFDAAVQDYEALYWGNITFVEDAGLVAAMDALRHEIRYFREGLEPADGLSAADMVKQRAHGVAIECRRVAMETGRAFKAF
jgi:hypothetical protein